MSTDEIIQQAKSLTREERAVIVDSILQSLREPDPEIEKASVSLALSRLQGYRSGLVEAIPLERLREEIRGRRHRK